MKLKSLFILILSLAFFIQIASGGSCGGEIKCECGDTVTKNYILEDNLICNNSALYIRANVNLDCRGFSITGDKTGTGISILGYRNTKIANCKIEDFTTGILVGTHRINTGNGWGANWVETIPSVDTKIYNNEFENLDEGIKTQSSYNDIIEDNKFKNMKTQSILSGSNSMNIYNNIFYKFKPKYSQTKTINFCKNGLSNEYLGDFYGPTCKCQIPQSDVLYNSKVNFCSGEYYLPDGISLGEKGDITCLGTHIYGDETKTGFKIVGASNTKINNCTISDYDIAISYSQKYVKNEGYYLSRYNKITNSTIYNVKTGISMNNGYRNLPNLAETVTGNTILAQKYSIYNTIQNNIKVENNYWGSNNATIINQTFYNSNKVDFIPYIKNTRKIDYFFNDKSFTYNQKEKKLIVKIFKNKLDKTNLNLSIKYNLLRNNEIIKNGTETLLDDKNSFFITKNLTLDLRNGDEVQFVIKKNNITEKSYENNIGKFIFSDKNKIEINVNSGFKVVDYEINKFLEKSLKGYNKPNKLKIEIKKDNIFYFEFPYGFFIKSKKEKNTTTILIKGSDLEGIVAGVKVYIQNKDTFEEDKYLIKNDKNNLFSIKIYDYINKQIINRRDSEELRKVIRDVLYDKTYSQDEKFISITNPKGDTMRYKLQELSPLYSDMLKKVLSKNQTPIIMGGGLWSDITTWQTLGDEFAKEGKNVFLIELTGGKNTECDDCYNYNYSFLTQDVFPKYVNYILNKTNKSKIIYIGHSNGARVSIDSLAKNYVEPDKIEKLIAVGVPGAFEGNSLLKKMILKYGNKTTLKNKDNTHVSILDLALFNTLHFNTKTKISTNLWNSYLNWMIKTNDSQPGKNLELSNFILIGGNLLNSNNDMIVTVNDENAIFENIHSENKKIFLGNYMHTGMSENVEIQNIIKKEILN